MQFIKITNVDLNRQFVVVQEVDMAPPKKR